MLLYNALTENSATFRTRLTADWAECTYCLMSSQWQSTAKIPWKCLYWRAHSPVSYPTSSVGSQPAENVLLGGKYLRNPLASYLKR